MTKRSNPKTAIAGCCDAQIAEKKQRASRQDKYTSLDSCNRKRRRNRSRMRAIRLKTYQVAKKRRKLCRTVQPAKTSKRLARTSKQPAKTSRHVPCYLCSRRKEFCRCFDTDNVHCASCVSLLDAKVFHPLLDRIETSAILTWKDTADMTA